MRTTVRAEGASFHNVRRVDTGQLRFGSGVSRKPSLELRSINAVVASFDALLPATAEEAVANVEISKEKETAQTRARSPGP